MCGIWLQIGHGASSLNGPLEWLQNRGPDFNRIEQIKPAVRLGASILHVQGDFLTEQPLSDRHGNVLAFNGEIFRFDPGRDGS